MERLFLCVILVFSTSFIGLIKSNALNNRSKLLKEYLTFLQLLTAELSYSNYSKISIPDILKRYSLRENSKITLLCKNVLERLYHEENLTSAYRAAVDDIYVNSSLNIDDKECIKETAESLGKFAIKGQEDLLYHQRERLKVRLSDAMEEAKTKGKMYRYLGFYVGISIAVFLI